MGDQSFTDVQPLASSAEPQSFTDVQPLKPAAPPSTERNWMGLRKLSPDEEKDVANLVDTIAARDAKAFPLMAGGGLTNAAEEGVSSLGSRVVSYLRNLFGKEPAAAAKLPASTVEAAPVAASASEAAAAPGEAAAAPAAGPQGPVLPTDQPRVLSGESALRQILGGQDNANLLKIARSRGINVTKEALLKPGTANPQILEKIVNDFEPEELEDVRDKYLQSTKFKHQFGDIGPEAWKTLSLQTYFPDLKIPQAVLNRTTKAIAAAAPDSSSAMPIKLPPGTTEEDLTPLLQESLKKIRAARQAAE